MTHVLYVVGQLFVGGTETQLLALVRGLDRSRYVPHVAYFSVAASPVPSLADEFRAAGCDVHVPPARMGKIRTFRWLLAVMGSVRPKLVQVISYAWYLGIPAAVITGIPYIIASERGIPLWKRPWHRSADRLLLRRASVVLVNARAVRDHVVAELGVLEERCEVILNGIALEDFGAAPATALGKPLPPANAREGPVIAAVGNLRPEKGVDALLLAFSRVLGEESSGASLWIVGEGPMRSRLELLSHSLGCQGRVHFLGHREDVPEVLRHASIGVLASRSEGLPNAVLEYMAAGLPVVATRVAGTPELVVEGRTGFLVEVDAPEQMADAILRLLDEPRLASGMGRAGRVRIEDEFSFDRMIRETQAAYRRVLSE